MIQGIEWITFGDAVMGGRFNKKLSARTLKRPKYFILFLVQDAYGVEWVGPRCEARIKQKKYGLESS